MYYIKIMYAHVLNNGKKLLNLRLLLAKSQKQSHLPKQNKTRRESDVVICSDDKSSSSS